MRFAVPTRSTIRCAALLSAVVALFSLVGVASARANVGVLLGPGSLFSSNAGHLDAQPAAGQDKVANYFPDVNHSSDALAVAKSSLVYVADARHHRVIEFDLTRKRGHVIAGSGGQGSGHDQLDHPDGIAASPKDGKVYIADKDNNRVLVFDPKTRQVTLFAGGNGRGNRLDQLFHPYGVAISPLGPVYISDSGNDRVLALDPETMIPTVVAGGEKGPRLNSPGSLAVSQSGTVYIVENGPVKRVVAISLRGQHVTGQHVTLGGLDGLVEPSAIAVSPKNGTIYLADHGSGRIRARRQRERTWSTLATLETPSALALATDDSLLIGISANAHAMKEGDLGRTRILPPQDGFQAELDSLVAKGEEAAANGKRDEAEAVLRELARSAVGRPLAQPFRAARAQLAYTKLEAQLRV